MSVKSPEIVEAVLRSPSLYRGEVRVSETKTSGFANLRSGRQVKDLLLPVLYWFLKEAPTALAVAPFRLIAGIARLFYWLPGNPLRQACSEICVIAARHGHHHEPKIVYRQFLRNIVGAGENYHLLLHGGPAAVLDRIIFRPDDQRKADEALESYGGAIIACPHNPGSAFSAVKNNRNMPLIAVMKNSATIRRTRLALEVFERMEVRFMMVRSGNPFELSRAMFAALKDHNVIAATVDNVDTSGGGVIARIFGQEIAFAPWAAKIAAKKKVPMIPTFYHSRGHVIDVAWGEPLVTDDLQRSLQHYVSFFEAKILEDPASWAYLADRKWRRIISLAARTDPGADNQSSNSI